MPEGLQKRYCSPTASKTTFMISIGGHRHRSQCGRYPTSDIDISYSDIGVKYDGLKKNIPISEVFWYRHQSSFGYPTLNKKIFPPCGLNPALLGLVSECCTTKLLCPTIQIGMSDIGYRINIYSYIQYNVGLRSLSPILEVPISGSVRYRWSRISD